MENGRITDDDRLIEFQPQLLAGITDVVCRLKGPHDVEYLEPTIQQAMESYLSGLSEIASEHQHRSRATDLPDTAFSQDELLSSFQPRTGA